MSTPEIDNKVSCVSSFLNKENEVYFLYISPVYFLRNGTRIP